MSGEERRAGAHRFTAASTAPLGAPVTFDGDESPWSTGVRVDRYELIEQIGSGGMGVVWAARDVDLGREVAVKLSFPHLHLRLLAEARAMARLSHPNVVTVHDVGSTGYGLFIAMELLTGGNLCQWLDASPRSPRAVLAKFICAGRGLAAAHRAGLVHCDFKPENVLLSHDGVARVSDFGLALASSEAHADETAGRRRTHDISLVGTPAYMAPEQLIGEPATERSDQFSFAVALYEALHGVRPFGPITSEAPAASILAAIMERRFIEPPGDRPVPNPLRDLVLRGLACSPGDRWPSMDALLVELGRCGRRRT